MKTLFLLGALLLGSAWPCAADQKNADQKEKSIGSCVWKVEGEKSTVYLAGSLHLLRREDLPLPKAFDVAYEDSARLVFEIAPEEAEGPEAMALSMKLGSYEEGKTVKDEVSEECYEELQKYAKEAGMPEGALDGFRPWLSMMTITVMEMMKIGALPGFGVEKVLGDRAEKDGKNVAGLETIKEQLGVFVALDAKTQEKMLMETLEERKTMADEYPKMVKLWRQGNTREFMKLAFDDLEDPEAKKFYERILFKRNGNWIEPIEKALSGEENVMVVVGTGHLVGKGSVVDLLKKKGHKVRRVRVPAENEAEPKKPKPKKRDLVPVALPGAA